MSWKGGFEGNGYTREEFRAWLRSQPKPSWVKFLVAHNTAAPYIKPPVSPSTRIKNLGAYYQSRGWSTGPNLIVILDKIYLGTPLAFPGTNSPGFNGKGLGIEVEGDYRHGVHDPKTGDGAVAWNTAAWGFAEIMDWLGFPLDDAHLKLHREDPETTHACPGDLVTKPWLMDKVKAARGVPASPDEPYSPTEPSGYARWVDTPGDTLNFRAEPGGAIKGTIPHGTKVTVLEDAGAWNRVKTPAGYIGWVFEKYLAVQDPKAPVPVPAPASPQTPAVSPVVPVGEAMFSPGNYAYDDFCVSWSKRFEGKMLTAYWDRNDWAIGYGHNNGSGVPPKVKQGMTITEAEANSILGQDLNLQLRYLKSYVNVPLTQGQVNALVLHIFQQGPGNFRDGKVRPLVNAEKHAEAAVQIENWPTTNAGLKRRRKVEAQIYRGELPTKW
jgi:GH24 family phage-related lysozyme (muramidase)